MPFRTLWVCVVVASLLTIIPIVTDASDIVLGDHVVDDVEDPEVIEASSNYFIENMGQAPLDIILYSREGNVHFTSDGIFYRFREIQSKDGGNPGLEDIGIRENEVNERGVVLKYCFVGANPVIPKGRERSDSTSNYFLGDDPSIWKTNVPNYMGVIYPDLWDCIDLIYRMKDGRVKYDIILRPGADPIDIRFMVTGSQYITIDDAGDLNIVTDLCTIYDSHPQASYMDDEDSVQIKYQVFSETVFGFSIGPYDQGRTLIIDPLVYSSFIGGSNEEEVGEVKPDLNGIVYMMGRTFSTDFPTTVGAYDRSNSNGDIFVSKMNISSSKQVFSTFVGGSGADYGGSIFFDKSGNSIFAGFTYSNNFPTTSGAYDTTFGGPNVDGFIAKLNETGASLKFSTYIGGSSDENIWDLFIDSKESYYAVGYTAGSGFPTTTGAYDTSYNGGNDGFVAKLNKSGASLDYSTYIGSTNDDTCTAIYVDSSMNAIVLGVTLSTNFPVTSGSYDTSHNGGYDSYVLKLNSLGSGLVFSTFIGGSSADHARANTCDSSGSIFITGYTLSSNFPTTSNAYDRTSNGNEDVYVTKMNNNGSAIVFSTYIGGSLYETPRSINFDSGYVNVLSNTRSSDYPTTSNAFDRSYSSNVDIVLSQLNTNGSMIYSTYFGKSGDDIGRSINSNYPFLYILGSTTSSDFYTTSDAYDRTYGGNTDVYLMVFSMDFKLPIIEKDNTAKSATTGEELTFKVNVSDNYKVNSVYVEYRYGTGSATNVTMSGSHEYTYKIIVPGTILSLFYTFHVKDSSNNWNHTVSKAVTIRDNDLPAFGNDRTPSTGTTGDPFNFEVDVSDNVAISQVTAEYWYGTGVHTNTTMTRSSGTCRLSITLRSDSTETMYYIFHAMDTSNNYARTTMRSVTIIDNDPGIITDRTPSTATTGDTFTFSFTVADNIAVKDVSLMYWFGSGLKTNRSFSISSEYTLKILIPHSLDTLHYSVHTNDTAGNWNTPVTKDIIVFDDDLPVFGSDGTDTSGSTGDPFTFWINVTDNIAVSGVFVEYWLGSGTKTNLSLSGPGEYKVNIDLPIGSMGSMSYIFHARDSSGNWNQTKVSNVPVTDNDIPMIEPDLTPVTATTGDDLTFSIVVTDNIGVASVWVEYWYGQGPHTNTSMSGAGTYALTITVQSDSLDEIHYIFRASDTSQNWNSSVEKIISVIDNDDLVFISDLTPDNGTTGDPFKFLVEVTDNIGVSTVWVEYWFGSGIHLNSSMGGTYLYSLNITLPFDSLDPLHYVIHANDTSDNWNQTPERTVTIIDNDMPVFGMDGTPASATTGDPLVFSIEVTDNILIDSVWVEYWYGEGEHFNKSAASSTTWNLTIMIHSNSTTDLEYIVHAVDSSGNWNHTPMRTVDIVDDDPCSFGSDQTPVNATTGERLLFDILVIDNIAISSVWVEYWYGDAPSINETMDDGPTYTWEIVVRSDYTGSMFYIFRGMDTSGNWNRTMVKEVIVNDNDDPIFGPDMTPDVIGTGETLNITVPVTDNVLVHSVHLEYWFGDGLHQNVTIEGLAPYNHSIAIPMDSLDMLRYVMSAIDGGGNWASISGMVEVVDIVSPDAVAGENIEVNEDIFVMFNGSGSNDNIGISNWSWTFTIDDEITTIFGEQTGYVFRDPEIYMVTLVVSDEAGNRDELIIRVKVLDVTNPIAVAIPMVVDEDTLFVMDGTKCSDNVAIINWTWSWRVDGQWMIRYGMSPSITFYEPGSYNLSLMVRDDAGLVGTVSFTLTVLDKTVPVVEAGTDWSIKIGEEVTLIGNGTDNVGIVNWTWVISDGSSSFELYGKEVVHKFAEAGNYVVTLKARDEAGNVVTDTITVEVKDDKSAALVLFAISALIVLLIIAGIVVLILYARRKGGSKDIDHEVSTPIEPQNAPQIGDDPDIHVQPVVQGPVEQVDVEGPAPPVDIGSPGQERIMEGPIETEPVTNAPTMEGKIEQTKS
jgi:hypothetical protein